MKFKTAKTLVLLVASSLVMSSCSQLVSKNQSYKILETYKDDESYSSTINSQGISTVGSNQKYTMSIKASTAEVIIKDNRANTVWSTNPQGRETAETTANIQNANSQIRISYFDNKNKLTTMDSFTECIEKNQFSFYKINNGIGVNYFFGEKQKVFLAPKIISVENYNKLSKTLTDDNLALFQAFYLFTSLEGMDTDPAGKAKMEETYPILKQKDVYSLRAANIDYNLISDDILQRVNDILAAGGYTEKDLENDNKLDLNKQAQEKKVQISLALEYRITNDGITATIPSKSISFDKTNITVTEIEVLPYFESKHTKENGYMVIPDGSGAIVNLNNQKKDLTYKQRVYGADDTIKAADITKDEAVNDNKTDNYNNSKVYLPIFGQKSDNSSFLGIIEKGASYASINCHTSNNYTNYNQIYSSFVIQSYEKRTSSYMNTQSAYATQKGNISNDLSVKYVLNDDKSADYNTMAQTYRKYLIDNKLIKTDNKSKEKLLGINTIASVKSKQSTFGIPNVANKAVTTFNQNVEIINSLMNLGVNDFDLNLFSWCNDGSNNKIMTKVSLISSLGSRDDFKNLINLNSKKHGVFTGVDFAYASKSGFPKKYGAKALTGLIGTTARIHQLSSSSSSGNSGDTYIINPKFVPEIVNKFISANDKYSKNIYDISDGSNINSDYSDKPVDREQSIEYITSALQMLTDKKYNIKFNGGNSYVLKYATALDNIDSKNSNNYLFDATIPFFQLVVSGLIPYYGEPLNLSDDFNLSFLNNIETGTISNFQWIYADNSELVNSPEDIYSANYKNWLDDAKNVYLKLLSIKKATANSRIVAHQALAHGVYKTTYENGAIVIVNYNSQPVNINNVIVNALNYKVVGLN